MDRELTFSRRSRLRPRFVRNSLVLSTLFCLPSTAGSQELLDRIVDFAESASGFALLEAPYQAEMGSGDKAEVTVPLIAGADYMVIGYCDEGCPNLDLVLFDPHGREIQADRLPDPEPILTYTAESTGRFTVQIQAVDCSTEACQVMVGVLASSSEPGVGPGEDMTGRLVLFAGELAEAGFTEEGNQWRGALLTDEIKSFPLILEEGKEYRFAAVCDKDCFDLDLALLDSAGVHLTSDQLPDEFPLVSYVPETTGEYRLEVFMVACALEPCGYRIASYSKPDTPESEAPSLLDAIGHQEAHRGQLAPGDEVLRSGAYLDVFQIEVEAGQEITVDLQSDDFDTLLRVLPPEGQARENDDYGRQLGHSRVDMQAEVTGIYTIHVTSYEPKATGVYRVFIGLSGVVLPLDVRLPPY
jgi:hypothetical protein